MTVQQNPAFPCTVFFCGTCDKEFNSPQALGWHRDKYHSVNHTCLLCDPVNGKLVEGVKIKVHLDHVHGLKDVVTCGCCHHVLENRLQLGTHHESLRWTGDLGRERILAKSGNKPGSLMQKNLIEKYKLYVARKSAEQPIVVSPKQPFPTTTRVRKYIVIASEDKENITCPPAKKFKNEKPPADTPEFRNAQQFFQKFMLPVLREFHEQVVALQDRK